MRHKQRPPAMPGWKPTKGGAYSTKSVRPFRIATDPRIGDGDPCIGCGGVRPPLAILHRDPFCRRGCCELWYLGSTRAGNLATRTAA